jgi:hypothetical protein
MPWSFAVPEEEAVQKTRALPALSDYVVRKGPTVVTVRDYEKSATTYHAESLGTVNSASLLPAVPSLLPRLTGKKEYLHSGDVRLMPWSVDGQVKDPDVKLSRGDSEPARKRQKTGQAHDLNRLDTHFPASSSRSQGQSQVDSCSPSLTPSSSAQHKHTNPFPIDNHAFELNGNRRGLSF